MAPTNPATTPSRAERVERYVHLDAAEGVLRVLLGGCTREEGPFAGMLCLGWDDITIAISGEPDSNDLYAELWPGETGSETREFRMTRMRSNMITSHLFSALAANPGFCVEAARHFAELAQRESLELLRETAEAESSASDDG